MASMLMGRIVGMATAVPLSATKLTTGACDRVAMTDSLVVCKA